jgi:hypothetical protein
MWRQAEGVVSRPSQRSVAPGGFLRLESDVSEVRRLIGFRAANAAVSCTQKYAGRFQRPA